MPGSASRPEKKKSGLRCVDASAGRSQEGCRKEILLVLASPGRFRTWINSHWFCYGFPFLPSLAVSISSPDKYNIQGSGRANPRHLIIRFLKAILGNLLYPRAIWFNGKRTGVSCYGNMKSLESSFFGFLREKGNLRAKFRSLRKRSANTT
jgi:hypothetical protein